MAKKIVKQSLGDFFVGQGDIIMFDAIADYAKKTLAALINPKSVGNVKEDTTNWTGEDVSTTVIRNEQGNVIATTPSAGTLAFEMTLANFSLAETNDLATLLLAGAGIDVNTLTVDWLESVGEATAFGFGVSLPLITRPVGIINADLNKTLIFPKAKITSALTIEDKMLCIHSTVEAQYLNIKDEEGKVGLQTGMIVNGQVAYE